MVDLSVLSRVSTEEGYLARNVLIVPSSIRWFFVCVGKEGGSVVYLLYVYDILLLSLLLKEANHAGEI